MAYAEGLGRAITEMFRGHPNVSEKKMSGGIVNAQPHGAREMDFTGKPLRGFVFVAPDGFESDPDLKSGVAL